MIKLYFTDKVSVLNILPTFPQLIFRVKLGTDLFSARLDYDQDGYLWKISHQKAVIKV